MPTNPIIEVDILGMSKVRDKKRRIAIKRKQKRRGKLRELRTGYFTAHEKFRRDQIFEKILKISPDSARQLINSTQAAK